MVDAGEWLMNMIYVVFLCVFDSGCFDVYRNVQR